MSKLYKLKNYKFILVMYVLILNTLGVFLVGSASPGDQKKQIIGMVSGIIIMVILSLIDYSFILRFSWIIYLLAVGLLALVLVAGDSSKGAQRWFEIGGIRFQPSELVKILLILFFAYYFMKYEEEPPSGLTGEWTGFRGERFDNVVETPDKINTEAGDYPVVWSFETGEGHAAPVIYKGRVYVLDYNESLNSDALRCFSLESGKEL